MKLFAVGLLLLGLIIFVFCFSFYQPIRRSEPFFIPRPQGNCATKADFDFWIYPGDSQLTFCRKGQAEYSIQGLRRVHNLKVDLIVLGSTGSASGNSTPYRIYENVPARLSKPDDAWGERLLLKGTSASDSPIDMNVIINYMPKDEDLWGRGAKVIISGEIQFPQKISDDKYVDREVPFREETPIRFAVLAEKEKYEAAYGQQQQEKQKVDLYNSRFKTFYDITKLFGFLCSLGLVGIAGWVFFRSKRKKPKNL